MANNPFDRTILNPREKPLSTDLNQAQSQLDYALRFFAQQHLFARASDTSDAPSATNGFMPAALQVVPSSPIAMSVVVRNGLSFFDDPTSVPSAINGIGGLDDLLSYKPVILMADVAFTVPAAPGVGNSRIDIIEARIRRETTNPTPRLILDPTTGAFNPNTVDKTLAFTLDGSTGTVISPAPSTVALSYKQGAAAATGTELEPSVTTGYVQIARINVGPLVGTIDKNVLVDRRKILGQGGVVPWGGAWRLQWNGGAPIVTTRHIVAPPGIRVGLIADSGARATGEVVVVGGQIIGAAATTRVAVPSVNNFDQMEVSGGGNAIVKTSIGPTSLDGYSPSVSSGTGTKFVEINARARFLIAGGQSNNTDVTLEDVEIYAHGVLKY
jgi:hypothetical protein